MPTTDYTKMTAQQWEDLGRRLREAEAEVTSTVQAEVVAGLQGYSAGELRYMRDEVIARHAEIDADTARRKAYLNLVLAQIRAVLGG